MRKLLYTTSLLILIFAGCEKIELLMPPATGFPTEKQGTGESEGRSVVFVMCDTSNLFIDEDAVKTNIETGNINDIFANNMFARPNDPAFPQDLALDIFPLLKNNDILKLQPPEGNLEASIFPGAFGTGIADEWEINSNWWILDPSDIDYGFNEDEVVVIEGSITEDETLTADKKYLISGQVFVKSGVILTIEPGTVIFGKNDVGIKSGVLCFNRGAKIIANGTPEKPIVFTATASVGERTRGQWGGIVFCGKAPSNKGNNILLEGLQGTDPEDGVYGGTNIDDNSGSLSYVRVEYAGIAVSPGNELNSITFAGVGTATTIHHIIISYAGDDAIEWFGGGSDVKYIGIYNTLDDDLDMDAGYSGSVQYAYIVRNPYAADESGASNIEVSSSKTVGVTPRTSAVISNVTAVGPIYQVMDLNLYADPKFIAGMTSKQDAACKVINSIFIGCPIGIQNP